MNKFSQHGKICPIICLVLALAVQLGIMIPYFGLAGIASNYNEYYDTTYKNMQVAGIVSGVADMFNDFSISVTLADAPAAEIHEWYDQCGKDPVDWVTDGEADKTSTGWTTAFKYNAIIYMILMILTVLMLCCILIPGVPPAAVTGATGCIVCFGTPMLAGGILSAVRLNSDLGTACSTYLGVSYIDTEDASAIATTFSMNADMMKLLFIIQFVFLCPMQCCAICGGGIGTAVMQMNAMNDNFKAM